MVCLSQGCVQTYQVSWKKLTVGLKDEIDLFVVRLAFNGLSHGKMPASWKDEFFVVAVRLTFNGLFVSGV